MQEAFADTVPASHLVQPDEMVMPGSTGTRVVRDDFLVTRRGNTLYVHLFRDPQSTAVVLKPLNIMPKRAVLLNNGQELEARVDVTPWHWRESPYLRIRHLPVNELAETVMVIKLEFDESVNE